jgi:Excalibur calcium-binding domain
MKKMIVAAIGGALLSRALLGAIGTANADVYYKNCAAAWADGAAPLHKGDPGYRDGLDRDGDGIACEKPPS